VRRGRGVADITAQTVTSDALGDELVLRILSEVVDKRKRALLFAHIALDLPLAAVARTLGQDRKTLEATVTNLLGRLNSTEGLRASLRDVRRAGRAEHYLDLAAKLGLSDWFCAHCNRFIVQPAVGRPRITCGQECRTRRNRGFAPRPTPPSSHASPQRPPVLQVTVGEAESMRGALRRVIRNIDAARDVGLSSVDAITRNKAIILLGFSCPVQLSPVRLAHLTMDEVIETRKGLEVLFTWGGRQARQYVTIPPDPDPVICPVRAVRAWRMRLQQHHRRGGPLFEELTRPDERIRTNPTELASWSATALIERAIKDAGMRPRKLYGSDLLPAYLKEVAINPSVAG
jgi:hypothetical protein